jgi:hypothetical protein
VVELDYDAGELDYGVVELDYDAGELDYGAGELDYGAGEMKLPSEAGGGGPKSENIINPCPNSLQYGYCWRFY